MRLRLHIRLKRLATETTGQEIAEAAIVLPVFFLILLGIIWSGRAYNAYATVTHAAAEGARAAVTPTCATCSNAFPTNAAVVNVVTTILQASRLDAAQIRIPTTPDPPAPAVCTTTSAIRVCRGVQLNVAASDNPQIYGTSVSFRYQYSLLTMNFQTINLQASGVARVED
jgi:Flp pilus assembly protein TadG